MVFKTTSSGIANMIPIEIRNGVKLLRAQGQSLREISRLLKLSRNAVRRTEAAYVMEKPYLKSPPRVLPPVYEVLERVVDLYGYVSVDTNRYSVPERLVGRPVSVYKHPAEIVIYHRGSEICRHPRLIGQRDARSTLPGHHR